MLSISLVCLISVHLPMAAISTANMIFSFFANSSLLVLLLLLLPLPVLLLPPLRTTIEKCCLPQSFAFLNIAVFIIAPASTTTLPFLPECF